MSTLLEEIKAQIVSLKTDVAQSNVGTVREISDGVAKIEGLSDAALNEMLEFPNGVTGIALNLEETEVGAIIIGDFSHIKEGDEVRTTGKLLQVPVGAVAARPRGRCARQADRRQGRHQGRHVLSGGKTRARHHRAQVGLAADPDRHRRRSTR